MARFEGVDREGKDMVTDQLQDLIQMANKSGLYDAADWVTSRIESPKISTPKGPLSRRGNPPVEGPLSQPFRGNQLVVVEKRTSKGALDFTGAQPPTGGMSFDSLYKLFQSNSNPTQELTWANLRAWLETKRWVVRVKVW
jgi:hypothetical protein